MKRSTHVLVAVTTATFMVTFDGAAVQMVLPELHRELGHGIYAVQWTMTAFLLVTTCAYLPAGRIGDNYGRDWLWGWGVLLFSAASVICIFMPNLWWLIGARGLQGLGAAATTANSAPLLVETFPQHRGRALAIGTVAIGLGLVLGPPAGAILTKALSWRLLFVVAVPLSLTAWWMARGKLPRSGRVDLPVDLWGALLSVVGVAAVLVAVTFGRHWGWATAATLSLLSIGVAALLGFFALERRRAAPLLRMSLFAERWFLSGALSALFGYAALFALTATMPFFLIESQHRGLVMAGLLVGVVPIALAASAPPAGLLSDRVGSRALCTSGLLAVTGGLVVGALLAPGSSTWWVVLEMALVGVGLGCFEAPNSAATLGSLRERDLGVGTATLGVMRNLGMTVGTALAATLLGATPADEGMPRTPFHLSGTHWALGAGALAGVIGALAAALRPAGKPRDLG